MEETKDTKNINATEAKVDPGGKLGKNYTLFHSYIEGQPNNIDVRPLFCIKTLH